MAICIVNAGAAILLIQELQRRGHMSVINHVVGILNNSVEDCAGRYPDL